MRNAFAQELVELAEEDERIVLLSGDIGNRLFDPYKEKFGDRFLNCGVAEANMIGVAAGLALKGFRPITYTIASFGTLRCLEQIRVDLCYHNLPVTIVGVGAGLSYASLGYTHHANEDIAILRSLPNMKVVCPSDPWETRSALRASLAQEGPTYLRLGKKGEPEIHSEKPHFEIGKGLPIQDGDDVCILSVGTVMPIVLEAAKALEAQGISVKVVSFHTVKPLDENLLSEMLRSSRLVLSVEEHSAIGGAGSAISEWLVSQQLDTHNFLPISLLDQIPHVVQNTKSARDESGVSSVGIVQKVNEYMKGSAA